MRVNQRDIERLLARSASKEQMESSRQRTLSYVQSKDSIESLESARDENRRSGWSRIAMIPAAAAVMMAVFIGLAWRQESLAIGESVPIAGTVLVDAESSGSRVAVIQGEARVRQGTIEKTLRSTVIQEIAWSPRAGAHMALSQQSVVAPANPSLGREANTPKWEVVSVLRCEPAGGAGGRGGGGTGFGTGPATQIDPERMVLGCKNLWSLIQLAYANNSYDFPGDSGVTATDYAFKTTPIAGSPGDWISREPYTIEAKAEKPVDPAMMRGPMLQTILEDRFKLKLGRENRDIPILALTVAKGGPKLKPHQEGSCVVLSAELSELFRRTPLEERKALLGGKPPCGSGYSALGGLPPLPATHVTADRMGLTVEEFIRGLMSLYVAQNETPIVDKTGLKGKFDFKLEYAFTPEEIERLTQVQRGSVTGDPRQVGRPKSDFDTGPTVWEALEQQLGLKLEKTKGPWPHLVIEHVERPSLN